MLEIDPQYPLLILLGYKSKYFPTCSFMEANLGNNPSYILRSLLAAREVIREGSIWKVKDGSLIQVSNHKWLPNRPMILGTPRPQMYVNELIDRATMQWDREKIFDLFAYRTRMDILSIPLGNNSARDVLVWKENKSQTFTVKSAYQVACKLKEATRVEHSTAASDRHISSRMWKLNIPLKVWTFVWQECSNILPTRDNLHQKNLRVNPRCELCCQHHESTGHLLWECTFARNVWALCSGKIQNCSNEAQDFARWWEDFLKLNWKNGPRSSGQYGMLEINFISSKSTSTQERSLMAPLDT